jgi:hypothetical protein
VLEGIHLKVGDRMQVPYSQGCKITVGGSWNQDVVTPPHPESDRQQIQEVVKVAQHADVIVMAIGGNEQTSREAWARKHLGDRARLELVGQQQELVTAIGLQGRGNLSFPTAEQEDATIAAFARLHLEVRISELDIDCSQGGQRTTTADVAANAQAPGGAHPTVGLSLALQQQLARRYSELFAIFLNHKKDSKLVTFWGVTDADSWRRPGNPLLFDRNGWPKPAFYAVIKAAGP